jgi:hypothetical protein
MNAAFVVRSAIGVLVLLAMSTGRADAQDYAGRPLDRHVYSTDWFQYRYSQELLLLDHDYLTFAHVRPYVSGFPLSLQAEPERRPPGNLLLSRQRRHLSNDNMTLNRIMGSRQIQTQATSPQLDLRFIPYFEEIASKDKSPTHRLGLDAEGWVFWSNNFQLHLRARIENHGELRPQFHGRIWQDKVTLWLDNAALYFQHDGFFASAGRSFVLWGPDSRDALLLSDHAPAPDRLWLGYHSSCFRFDFVAAKLSGIYGRTDQLNRFLSAHRVSFRKSGWFEIGISEVVLYGGYGRQLEWHYLNPFLPYYLEQWNHRTDDNLFLSCDLSVYWPKRARVFAELMADDFQIDFVSEPHQVAYKLGIDALEPFAISRLFTHLSYTRVNPTVYGQNKERNLYLHYGEPIGYFGGNDQDRWLALLRYHFSVELDGELEFERLRKGEGRIERHDEQAVEYTDQFPTGIVEKATALTLRLRYFLPSLIEGHLETTYRHFEDYGHVVGRDHDRLEFNLLVSWYLSGSFR